MSSIANGITLYSQNVDIWLLKCKTTKFSDHPISIWQSLLPERDYYNLTATFQSDFDVDAGNIDHAVDIFIQAG